MNRKTPPIPVSLLMIIGIVAISFSSIFIKWSTAPVSVQGMYRLLFTSLLMLPFARSYSGAVFVLRKKDWIMLVSSGVMLALHFLLWMGSLKYTSVASSTMIMALEPVFIMLGAYFLFREKTALSALLAMSIAIAGVMFIGWGDVGISADNLKGDLLSIGGTAAVAVHMLIGQKVVVRMPSYLYSLIVFISASIVFAIYNLVMGIPFFAYPPREWGIFLLLAVVPTVFGHILFNWLLQYVSATTVSMNILGEPVGASILAYLLLGEQLTGLQWAGSMLVMSGLAAYLYSGRKKSKEKIVSVLSNAS
ncbi:DMT family transporter [Paenibacillus sp. BR2-3]|uniref:DMT family transporter n=1 Tax=Paenibacillus sp. BR2-3 TaxID=3048494 RepID=UPI00397749D4